MNFFIEVCLSNALVATGMALVIAVVSRLCRRPVLSHALWVVVVLKLVSPPLFRIPIAWQSQPPVSDSGDSDAYGSRSLADEPTDESLADRAMLDEQSPVELAWTAMGESTDRDAASLVVVAAQDGAGNVGCSIAFSDLGGRLLDWSEWPNEWGARTLGFVWLAGSCGWFVLASGRLWRFHRLLSLGHAGGPALQGRSREIAQRLGIRVAPEVWLVPGRVSPLLWSISGRARLVLPEDLLASLDEEQLDSLIVHEMAHARRLDHWVRWLEFLAMGIYWWHPVVWWARWEIRQAEEACCDAWVVSARPGIARAYAEALVETVGFLTGARKVLPPLASGIGHVQHLRRRLTMILHSDPTQPKSWRAYAGSLMLALMVLPVAPYQAKGRVAGDGDEKAQASQDPDRRALEQRLSALEAKMERLLNALERDGGDRKAATAEKLSRQNEERRAQEKAAAAAAKAQSAAVAAERDARAAAADAAKKARQNAEHAKRAADEAIKHVQDIDGGELGRKIGEVIRQSFDPERMAELGRQIGEAVNSGVDPARMEELGRQIEEAVRKAVDSKEFDDLGRQIEEAVNKNLDPKRMQELERQIEEAVSKAVDSDLFEELGRSIEAIMEKSGGKEVVIERKKEKEKEKAKPSADEKAAKAAKVKPANPPAKPSDDVDGRIRSLEEKMDRVLKALESR
jgi:bla regulator protein BlaR1